MLNFQKELAAKDIVKNITSNIYAEALLKQYINQAIAYLFNDQVRAIFRSKDDESKGATTTATLLERPKQPTIEPLKVKPIEILSLLVSAYDEVSIKGSYVVQKDIFLYFLGLDREKDFEKPSS